MTEASEPDDPAPTASPEKKPRRKLPEHLPRREERHEPATCACPRCGSERLRKVGEDVTEVLEYVPGRFEVVRHVRPAYSCAKCEAMTQAPMPAMPIPRAMAGASVLAHVIMSKYADHLPLYRQAEIYARDGLDLDRSTLADWMGKAAWLLRPLADRIGEHVMAGTVIHADDTPVPVLAPGNGKTKTGRLWIYLRDERPHAGPAPPAVLYRYTPDRKGERCREHLSSVLRPSARRRLCRLRRALRERRGQARQRHRGRLLGARAAQVLRRAQGQRLSHRARGAGADRGAVRHRAHDRRQISGPAAYRAPEPGQGEARQARRVARPAAEASVGQERTRRRHPLCPITLGCPDGLCATTGGWRSPTTPPRMRSGPSRWAARTGSSPAAMPAATEPRSSTR